MRNSFGTSWIFYHHASSNQPAPTYPSSLPGFFPDITGCTCRMEKWDLPVIGIHGFRHGLCKGVILDGIPGFPSLKSIPHTATLGFHGVNIFNSESSNESQVISLSNGYEGLSPEAVLKERLYANCSQTRDSRVIAYFGYPFFTEAMVVGLLDELFCYRLDIAKNGRVDVIKTPHNHGTMETFSRQSETLETYFSKQCGVLFGDVDIIVRLRPLKGMYSPSLLIFQRNAIDG